MRNVIKSLRTVQWNSTTPSIIPRPQAIPRSQWRYGPTTSLSFGHRYVTHHAGDDINSILSNSAAKPAGSQPSEDELVGILLTALQHEEAKPDINLVRKHDAAVISRRTIVKQQDTGRRNSRKSVAKVLQYRTNAVTRGHTKRPLMSYFVAKKHEVDTASQLLRLRLNYTLDKLRKESKLKPARTLRLKKTQDGKIASHRGRRRVMLISQRMAPVDASSTQNSAPKIEVKAPSKGTEAVKEFGNLNSNLPNQDRLAGSSRLSIRKKRKLAVVSVRRTVPSSALVFRRVSPLSNDSGDIKIAVGGKSADVKQDAQTTSQSSEARIIRSTSHSNAASTFNVESNDEQPAAMKDMSKQTQFGQLSTQDYELQKNATSTLSSPESQVKSTRDQSELFDKDRESSEIKIQKHFLSTLSKEPVVKSRRTPSKMVKASPRSTRRQQKGRVTARRNTLMIRKCSILDHAVKTKLLRTAESTDVKDDKDEHPAADTSTKQWLQLTLSKGKAYNTVRQDYKYMVHESTDISNENTSIDTSSGFGSLGSDVIQKIPRSVLLKSQRPPTASITELESRKPISRRRARQKPVTDVKSKLSQRAKAPIFDRVQRQQRHLVRQQSQEKPNSLDIDDISSVPIAQLLGKTIVPRPAILAKAKWHNSSLVTLEEQLSKLVTHNYFVDALDAWKHILQRRLSPSRTAFQNFLIANASSYGSIGQLISALETMGFSIPDLNNKECQIILHGMSVHPDYIMRTELLSKMEQSWYGIDEETHHLIIAGLLRELQFERALEEIDGLMNSGLTIPKWLFDMTAAILINVQEFEEASRVLHLKANKNGRSGLKPLLTYYIDHAAESSSYDACRYAWTQWVETNFIQPSMGTCSLILSLAARHGNVVLAKSVYDYMKTNSQGVLLDSQQYLVEAYCNAGKIKDALRYLFEVRLDLGAVSQNLTSPIFLWFMKHPHVNPAIYFNQLLKLQSSFRARGVSYHVIKPAYRSGINVFLKACLMQYHRRAKDAWIIYKRCQTESTLEPGPVALIYMSELCHKTQDAEQALQLMQSRQASGKQLSTLVYDRIIRACLAGGYEVDKVIDIYEEMISLKKMPLSSTLKAMYVALCEANHSKRAQLVEKLVGQSEDESATWKWITEVELDKQKDELGFKRKHLGKLDDPLELMTPATATAGYQAYMTEHAPEFLKGQE